MPHQPRVECLMSPSVNGREILAAFGVGVYVGIYLDQNRQIQPVSSPKELFGRFLDEADHFLTGVREENTSTRDQVRKLEDDFFKDVEDWFKPKKHYP